MYSGTIESGFEGAFNNYAAGATDPHERLVAMAANAGLANTFQGVEPMGIAILLLHGLSMTQPLVTYTV